MTHEAGVSTNRVGSRGRILPPMPSPDLRERASECVYLNRAGSIVRDSRFLREFAAAGHDEGYLCSVIEDHVHGNDDGEEEIDWAGVWTNYAGNKE